MSVVRFFLGSITGYLLSPLSIALDLFFLFFFYDSPSVSSVVPVTWAIALALAIFLAIKFRKRWLSLSIGVISGYIISLAIYLYWGGLLFTIF